MKIVIGKQIEGPTNWIPSFTLWGGCLFVNAWRRSLMIVLPEWIVRELAWWGIDAIGD